MAKNPNPSFLDPGQIAKRAFDETTDRWRVDVGAEVNFSGQQEVSITAPDDSIQAWIKDGNGNPITQANPLDVRIADSTAGVSKFVYKQATNIAPAATDDNVFVAGATKARLKQVIASASGLIRLDVFAGVIGSETLYFTFFNGGSNNPIINETLPLDFDILSGQRIIFRLTNREASAQNMYSTISAEQLTY